MSFWTTLRDDLIPFQWFKHGGNKKDWLRRAVEFPLAIMGAQALPSLGQGLLGNAPVEGFQMGLQSGVAAPGANIPEVLGSKLSGLMGGGGMNQKQLMMMQMAMNMAKPGEPPQPAQAQPMGAGGPIPPAPSMVSPTPPMGMGVAGALNERPRNEKPPLGEPNEKPLPGESLEDYIKRMKLQGGVLQ